VKDLRITLCYKKLYWSKQSIGFDWTTWATGIC